MLGYVRKDQGFRDCHTSNFSRTKNVTREEQDVADEAYLVHGSGEDKGFATLSPNSIPQRAYDMADDDTDEYRPHSRFPSREGCRPRQRTAAQIRPTWAEAPRG